MPGQSAGNASSTTRNDSVPPVDAPMQTTVSVVRAMACPATGAGIMTSAVSFASGPSCLAGFSGRVPGARFSRARAAAFTASQMRMLASCRNCGTSIRGLRITSTAPASSACINVADPSSVSDEHITTGSGCCAISLRRKVMPSIRGISTSSVMTSGTSSWMRRAADERVRRGADDFDFGIGRQNLRHGLTHRGGVIDDEDADLCVAPCAKPAGTRWDPPVPGEAGSRRASQSVRGTDIHRDADARDSRCRTICCVDFSK